MARKKTERQKRIEKTAQIRSAREAAARIAAEEALAGVVDLPSPVSPTGDAVMQPASQASDEADAPGEANGDGTPTPLLAKSRGKRGQGPSSLAFSPPTTRRVTRSSACEQKPDQMFSSANVKTPVPVTKTSGRKKKSAGIREGVASGTVPPPRRSSRISSISDTSSVSVDSVIPDTPIAKNSLVKETLPPLAPRRSSRISAMCDRSSVSSDSTTPDTPDAKKRRVKKVKTGVATKSVSGAAVEVLPATRGSTSSLSDRATASEAPDAAFEVLDNRHEVRYEDFDVSLDEVKAQFEILEVPGDGNCLFRCLSFFLVGHQEDHVRVRREVVDFVCRNWQDYAMQRLEYDVQQYRLEMSRDAAYGSELEAVAFARMHRLNIMVHRQYDPMIRWNMQHINEGGNASFHHMLFSGMARAHHMDGHYRVLYPRYDIPDYESPGPVTDQSTGGEESLCSDGDGKSSVSDPTWTSSNSKKRPVSRKRLTAKAARHLRRKQYEAAKQHKLSNATPVPKPPPGVPEPGSPSEGVEVDDPTPSEGPEALDFVFAAPVGRPRACNRRVPDTYKCAVDLKTEDVTAVSCGTLTARCPIPHCRALHFEAEKKNALGRYGTCCTHGKVSLEPLKDCPDMLHALLTGNDPDGNGRHFRMNIRQYNSAFQFASFNADNIEALGPGPPCFKIQGNVYHRIHCADPLPNRPRRHNQIYFVDSDRATDCRLAVEPKCKPNILRALELMVREINPFCASFVMMKDVMEREQAEAEAAGIAPREVILNLVVDVNTNLRTHNLPVSESEIAVVFFGDDPPFRVDARCHSVSGRSQTISNLSGILDPMVYPLLFPRGDPGFRLGLKHHPDYSTAKYNSVTMRQFYKFRMAIRDGFSVLHSAGTLFQQYVVDAWIKTEGNELRWIRENQVKLRRESYVGLADHVAHQAERQGFAVGLLTVMPATHVNSPRFFAQNCQDAMTTMMKNGMPDFMITMSANPNWPEIKDHLRPGEVANSRPDITVPVFQMRLEMLLNDLMVKKILGHVVNYVYAIEFQKRGLPHAHIVVTMRDCDKPRTGADLDKLIRADIPDPVTEPRLYEIVTKKMIHNVCSVRCWKPETRQCSKKFPKPYVKDTVFNFKGRAVHKRLSPADGGRSFMKAGHLYTDADVVPYNPYLMLKYDAHINVEACVSERCFLYICKYITKGNASANVVFRDVVSGGADREAVHSLDYDEVKTYETYRYVSPAEACYRLFEYRMFVNTDTVHRLPLHLEDHQRVVFNEGCERDAYLHAMSRDTQLTGWFKVNADPGEAGVLARTITYEKAPEMFVWHMERGLTEWRPRRRGFGNLVSRLYDVSPAHVELFHMRILLTHVRGATSFEDLRTVAGEICPTYKEACVRLHLLADDGEYEKCMERAAQLRGSRRVRQLFAYMVMYCQLTDPAAMLERHMDNMIEEYLHNGVGREEGVRQCLVHLSSIFARNHSSNQIHGLPEPGPPPEDSQEPDLPRGYYLSRDEADARVGQLNAQQKAVYDTVFEDIESYRFGEVTSPKLVYVDGPGGTGKTFLFNTLIANMQQLGLKVEATAWTGIAATLLFGGQTCHRMFSLPLRLDKDSTLNINAQSPQAARLLEADLIIVDEVSMAHKDAFRAVDAFLQFITGRDSVFAGKPFLFGGDFRQLLPVINSGVRHSVVEACVKNSDFWPLMRKYALTENLRAGPDQQEWAAWLLQLGNGTLPPPHHDLQDRVEIDRSSIVVGNDMAKTIFGPALDEDVAHRAILTLTNAMAMRINEDILALLPGDKVTLYSADELVEKDDQPRVTQEVLNSMTPSGFPPHELNLKVGVVVMLLRNLDVGEGLTNGTRLQVLDVHPNLLHCRIVTDGAYVGNEAYLPRIKMVLDDIRVLPFQMIRVQFPVRLSYAMTVNKAQGQTFRRIGLVLDRRCFTHGQLYVAASRVSRLLDFKVKVFNSPQQGSLLKNEPARVFATNVVWRELLDK